jgi:hypothetical protein
MIAFIKVEDVAKYTEIAKNISEIVALMIGAGWAVYIFIIKEAPGLAPRIDITNNISWFKTEHPDQYRAQFRLTIKNIGITSFKIYKVKFTAWKFPKVSLSPEQMHVHITRTNLLTGDIFFERVYSENEPPPKFVSHYVPGVSKNDNWNWLFRKDEEYWVCFQVEFYTKDTTTPTWSARNWSPIGENIV